MTDVFTIEKRSDIMRQVWSNRNRSTELKLIHFFKLNKITGWKRNYKLFGKPDFVFLKCKVAIFLDGCFWHGHDCRNTKPQNNKTYWENKIERNKLRDDVASITLSKKNWTVVRIWECELKDASIILKKLNPVLAYFDRFPLLK